MVVKKLTILFLFISLFLFSCKKDNTNDETIPTNGLPTVASVFLHTYFPNNPPQSIEKEEDSSYSVDLLNGVEVDFDAEGQWKEVSAKDGNALLSIAFVNQFQIISYLENQRLAQSVYSIKKTARGYEVELLSQAKLFFDWQGNILSSNQSGVNQNANLNEFVKKYFGNTTVVSQKQKKDGYELYLNDGTEIKFDRYGNWEEIENKRAFSSFAFLPEKIHNYLINNKLLSLVEKIERKNNGYEVELKNSTDYYFDREGNFIRFKR